MLDIKNLDVKYSGIHALRGVSLNVDEGETVALIGPNGAGKSSLLNAVSGIVRAAAGTISFTGENIANTSAWGVANKGAYTLN